MKYEVIEYTFECEGIAQEEQQVLRLNKFWNDYYEQDGYELTFIDRHEDHLNPRMAYCDVFDVRDEFGHSIATVTVRKLKRKVTYRS